MNDIAKMQREFDEKIRIAKLENQLNEELEKHGVSLGIFTTDTKTGRYLCHFHKVNESWNNKFSEHDAQTILRLLPMTESKEVSVGAGKPKILLPYEVTVRREPKEPRTTLKIHYIHDNLELWVDMPIDERNHELMGYFQKTQRELDDSTIGIHYGCVSPREKSYLRMLPFLTFNCGSVVRFYGGTHLQTSEGHITSIVETIINDDFSWEKSE